jgi:hypothetical protein
MDLKPGLTGKALRVCEEDGKLRESKNPAS